MAVQIGNRYSPSMHKPLVLELTRPLQLPLASEEFEERVDEERLWEPTVELEDSGKSSMRTLGWPSQIKIYG